MNKRRQVGKMSTRLSAQGKGKSTHTRTQNTEFKQKHVSLMWKSGTNQPFTQLCWQTMAVLLRQWLQEQSLSTFPKVVPHVHRICIIHKIEHSHYKLGVKYAKSHFLQDDDVIEGSDPSYWHMQMSLPPKCAFLTFRVSKNTHFSI